MDVGLTVDAVGTQDQFSTILDLLCDHGVRATFFVGTKAQPGIIEAIHDNGHEIGSHTYSHPPSLQSLTYEEKRQEIRGGHDWLTNALRERVGEAAIRGFRAPYYNFDPDIPRILEEMGYLWDSTKAYFPILGRPFRAERHGGIVELPSLHPDDHTLLRRIGLTEEQTLDAWKRSYDMSAEAFVWGIHPYICAENSPRTNMLERFIEHVREDGGVFMPLSDVAKRYAIQPD